MGAHCRHCACAGTAAILHSSSATIKLPIPRLVQVLVIPATFGNKPVLPDGATVTVSVNATGGYLEPKGCGMHSDQAL